MDGNTDVRRIDFQGAMRHPSLSPFAPMARVEILAQTISPEHRSSRAFCVVRVLRV